MFDSKITILETKNMQQLADALYSIGPKNQPQNSLPGAITKKEIINISARLQAMRLQQLGKKYSAILANTNISQTSHHGHIPPASAV